MYQKKKVKYDQMWRRFYRLKIRENRFKKSARLFCFSIKFIWKQHKMWEITDDEDVNEGNEDVKKKRCQN